jgi:hypothetical protein
MKTSLLVLGASVVFLALSAAAQLTVDATGPIRQRHREPTSGSGGGVGRNLTLRVRMETQSSAPDENGGTLVKFILTNSGKGDLTFPISPNPGDFEPTDGKRGYTVRVLSLCVTSDKQQANILLGQVSLYGSDSVAGSLVVLAPGESMQVLSKVAFPPGDAERGSFVFVGHAMLGNETVKAANGQTLSETQEIGSASSSEYSAAALLGWRD